MKINDKARDGSYNAILAEKLHRYRHYYLEELININILLVKKYYLLIKVE